MDRTDGVSRSPVVGPSKPRLVKVLGPGLISGAANDDPTAIATYSQAGAQFGFALCWLMFVIYPFMAVVQQVSARIGRTTGNGLAGNVRRHYPRWLLQIIVLLLLVSNTVAISADLAAMADVLRLLIGGPPLVYVLVFGALCVLLQIYMQYTRYVAVLKWITLSLLSYFGAVLMVDVRWSDFLDAILRPRIVFEKDYLGRDRRSVAGHDDADGLAARGDGGVHDRREITHARLDSYSNHGGECRWDRDNRCLIILRSAGKALGVFP